MNPGLYLLVKLIAYCVWCYLGLRLFRREESQLAVLLFLAWRIFRSLKASVE
jgi:hypothetical protein